MAIRISRAGHGKSGACNAPGVSLKRCHAAQCHRWPMQDAVDCSGGACSPAAAFCLRARLRGTGCAS